MGLGIVSLSVLNGLTTLTDLYGHARDIRVNKDEENKFVIECNFFIYKVSEAGLNVRIMTIPIRKIFDDDFLTKTWGDVYTIVKEVLTEKGIQYETEPET